MWRQKARDSEPSCAAGSRARWIGPKPASCGMARTPACWKALLAPASARAIHGGAGRTPQALPQPSCGDSPLTCATVTRRAVSSLMRFHLQRCRPLWAICGPFATHSSSHPPWSPAEIQPEPLLPLEEIDSATVCSCVAHSARFGDARTRNTPETCG